MKKTRRSGNETATLMPGVEIAQCEGSQKVPKEMWMWMERQICEGDGVKRMQAQRILQPRDDKMRYAVAILGSGERQDVMGRSRRVNLFQNYRETRANSGRAEIEEVGDDKGKTSMVAQWGWRLHTEMETW